MTDRRDDAKAARERARRAARLVEDVQSHRERRLPGAWVLVVVVLAATLIALAALFSSLLGVMS